jgi:dTDP-4-dehydrorhamnose 3,5-epimerase
VKITNTAVPDVLVIEPEVFFDERGFFFESFSSKKFKELTGLKVNFVQDNLSRSSHNVLRGLHYQLNPAQGKIVQVLHGDIFDVAVDLRQHAPTFGKWIGTRLSATNRLQHWIPSGFAHGFLVISESADVFYKTTTYYEPNQQRGICWNDPDIGIEWPIQSLPVLSLKDRLAPSLQDCEFIAFSRKNGT